MPCAVSSSANSAGEREGGREGEREKKFEREMRREGERGGREVHVVRGQVLKSFYQCDEGMMEVE